MPTQTEMADKELKRRNNMLKYLLSHSTCVALIQVVPKLMDLQTQCVNVTTVFLLQFLYLIVLLKVFNNFSWACRFIPKNSKVHIH